MTIRLLRQTLYWQRVRLLVVGLAAFGWGLLIPVFYTAFSDMVRGIVDQGLLPEELVNFGSGSLLTLPGAMTLGTQHPLALAMLGTFAVGATSTAVAGERERGTLEVLLARPISRRGLYAAMLVALLISVAVILVALLAGMVAGAALLGVADEIDASQLPLVLINGFLLWTAFATFSLAASVSFDRAGPAIGLSLAYLLINYFLEVLGSLWREVEWTQQYSLFHYFNAGAILTDAIEPIGLLIVAVAAIIPILYALVVFPRRDLAAPS